MSDLKPRAVSSYTASLDTSVSSVKERHIVNPASSDRPIVEDVVVKEPGGDILEVHRHVLVFDPGTPEEIELKLIDVAQCTLDSGASQLSAQRQVPCDERIATLWVPLDERSLEAPAAAYISIWPHLPLGLPRKGKKAAKTEFGVARFYEGGDDIYDFGLCPVSGIATGLKESSMRVYDFVGGDR